MRAEPLRREVLPFLLIFGALGAVALLLEALLRALDVAWIGRYLGIPGTLLILASFGYSLRKRKAIRLGRPAHWLRVHEGMAWLGSALVLAHAGLTFKAVLAWLALGAMLINVISGLTGQFLLDRSWRHLVRQWRIVHLPITLAFATLATAHIVAELLFWSWR
jgi:uncharacterized MnhB-related membrane protein